MKEKSIPMSNGSLGWTVRKIVISKDGVVLLEDGVTFTSPCLSNAKAGETWAVKYEPSVSVFGQIKQAVLLEGVVE